MNITDMRSLKPTIRLLATALVGGAALMLTGCADSPGSGNNGQTSGGNGSCTNATDCPVVTVLLDGSTFDSLPDTSTPAQLTWNSTNTDTSSNGKPCTPSGGLGTSDDPWTHSGPLSFQSPGFPNQATGFTEQPPQNGIYVFVLTCLNTTGDGASAGTATLTVGPIGGGGTTTGGTTTGGTSGVGNPSPIDVTVKATPAAINLGSSSVLTWTAVDHNGTTDNSIVCMHSSSPDDPTWDGAAQTPTGSVTITPTAAVVYTYVLTCRNAAGGSGAGVAALSVNDANNPPVVQCPPGQQFTAFRNTSASDTTFTATAGKDGLCLLCGVTPTPPVNLVSAANAAANVPAVISHDVGLLVDNVFVTVADTAATITPQSGGTLVGFIVSTPSDLLRLDLLRSLTVETLSSSGTVVQTETGTQLVGLDLLGLLANPRGAAATFVATQPFTQLRLSVGGVANVLTTLDVFEGGACVAPDSTIFTP